MLRIRVRHINAALFVALVVSPSLPAQAPVPKTNCSCGNPAARNLLCKCIWHLRWQGTTEQSATR
jgi:hypothetical protein